MSKHKIYLFYEFSIQLYIILLKLKIVQLYN
jgi:hypothetical protein